jgi:hypothetical protein
MRRFSSWIEILGFRCFAARHYEVKSEDNRRTENNRRKTCATSVTAGASSSYQFCLEVQQVSEEIIDNEGVVDFVLVAWRNDVVSWITLVTIAVTQQDDVLV